MATYCALTVRKLKPGSYDDWRRAWWPDSDSTEMPEGTVYVTRNVKDPDEIIAFGFYEEDLTQRRSEPEMQETQRSRFERMAPYVDSTGADGVYEVIEEVRPT